MSNDPSLLELLREQKAESLYTQHFVNPEDVAKKWSNVLVAHLGIREAAGCAAFSTAVAEQKLQTCALPPGWVFDYAALTTDDEEKGNDSRNQEDGSKNNSKKVESSSAVPLMVLKSRPPKTRIYEQHPRKGDCLVASEPIKAGTTLVTEPSLLVAPQDPANFFVAAAAAKAVEHRSRAHFVVSRAAAAAASFMKHCYQASGEDDTTPTTAAVNTSTAGAPATNNSSFSLLRIMCPQWVGALIFTTLVRIGNTAAFASANNNNGHKIPALDILAPGWEVVLNFSACSCGGVLDDEPVESLTGAAAASTTTTTTTTTTTASDSYRKVQHEDSVELKRVREINNYRTSRWSEWMCAAKLMHRIALRHLPDSSNSNSNNKNSNAEPKQILFEYLTSGKSASSSSGMAALSDEALFALALDVNGFLTTDSIISFMSAKAQNARFLIGKSVMRAFASQRLPHQKQKQKQQHGKPVSRLAYFLDALSSNAVEVSVPGVPKRLAVFSYSRLAEHECRPSCCVSFLDAPTLHGSAAFVPATQLQWDDPVHGCLITGGLRHEQMLRSEKIVDEVRHERSAAGHPMAAYGGGCAVNILLVPSILCLSAVRDVAVGEPVSIAYTGSTLMTWNERQGDIVARYGFRCGCIWCAGFAPDLARAFVCPHCPKGQGVVCPRSDGSQLNLWECIQCGFHPDMEFVENCCERERALSRVKADSAAGLQKLVQDEFLHYSHALVCRKLDGWAERAWRQQEAETCIAVVEVLLRCIDRLGTDDIDGFAAVIKKSVIESGVVAASASEPQSTTADPHVAMLPLVTEERAQRRGLSRWTRNPPRDVLLAQYLELLGKANHAVGNAHTARWSYGIALAIRERSGQALSWWCRATRYMALTKSLADLMDSK